jgi:hypothetical protein
MAAMGHFDPFPPPRLNGRCPFRRYVRAPWSAARAVRVRGLLGLTEPSLMRGGRTMEQYTEAFVGIDTAKNKHALAIADPGRDGEIRYLGEIDSAPAAFNE